MRTLLLLLTLLHLTAVNALGNDGPTEIFISADVASNETVVENTLGGTRSFVFRSEIAQEITLMVSAENGVCGLDMQRSSERGFQPSFNFFPGSRAFRAKKDETFTFSFFQTRQARMQHTDCNFSVSIR